MNEREVRVRQILGEVEAVVTDSHLVYASWRHGRTYVNKDAVYPFVRQTSELCEMMAEAFQDDGVETVVGPAVGGVVLKQEVAKHLESLTLRGVRAVHADKEGDGFVIKRGYKKHVEGRRVLVVEDILTTGGSARKVVEAVRANGGEVVGVVVLCNRGGVTAEALGNVPRLVALLNVQMDSWDEAECPLCKQGVPINTELGKGKEYLAKKGGN